MLSLPDLDLEEVPLRLCPDGKLEFCEPNREAVLASFALKINAESSEEWEFSDIFMGTQKLTGQLLIWAAQYFEEKYIAEIQDHINEHLQDVADDMEYANKYEWMVH
jgi:hypothetical protein